MRTRKDDVELCAHKTFATRILKIGLLANPEGCNSAEMWGGRKGE
jgi:hypothetical protein